MSDAFTVTGINGYVRSLMDSDDLLRDVWVEGEISNLKRTNSGYVYFTLKDSGAQLRCALFKRIPNAHTLEEGALIQAHGKITLYVDRGDCQLYVDEVRASGGVGQLYEQFEALKRKLDAEGLFDEIRKRPMPAFPKVIGVVTSADAAGFKDVLNVLSRRFPLAQVVLSHTLVQGNDAPPQIVRALEKLVAYGKCDVVLVCRGGGSIEDLWCFNDERVARAISDCPVPVISGVGHETDFTIADFVADLRAPTPSAAAEILTPNITDLQDLIEGARLDLDYLLQSTLEGAKQGLTQAQRTLEMLSPQRTIADMQQRLDTAQERLNAFPSRLISLWRERLASKQDTLEATNPHAVLARGYAIVTRKTDGQAITQPKDAPNGTAITIQLKNGTLFARTEDETTHGNYNRTLF